MDGKQLSQNGDSIHSIKDPESNDGVRKSFYKNLYASRKIGPNRSS